jgi:mannosyl-3-phosphoglycerate phosphatase
MVRASPDQAMVPTVVFSDADSIPINPDGATFGQAAEMLWLLRNEPVAVVLCSSKTRAELELLQQRLSLRHPFICENGAATLIPDGYFAEEISGSRDMPGYRAVEFGRAYVDVADVLYRTAHRLGIEIVGFRDMSVEEVAQDCGITLLQARLAKLREYEEPFRVLDRSPFALPRLTRALHAARLRCAYGRRYRYAGGNVDKAVGIGLLRDLYHRAWGPVRTLGVADTLADEHLPALVDEVTLVAQPDLDPHDLGVIRWSKAIMAMV